MKLNILFHVTSLLVLGVVYAIPMMITPGRNSVGQPQGPPPPVPQLGPRPPISVNFWTPHIQPLEGQGSQDPLWLLVVAAKLNADQFDKSLGKEGELIEKCLRDADLRIVSTKSANLIHPAQKPWSYQTHDDDSRIPRQYVHINAVARSQNREELVSVLKDGFERFGAGFKPHVNWNFKDLESGLTRAGAPGASALPHADTPMEGTEDTLMEGA